MTAALVLNITGLRTVSRPPKDVEKVLHDGLE